MHMHPLHPIYGPVIAIIEYCSCKFLGCQGIEVLIVKLILDTTIVGCDSFCGAIQETQDSPKT